jgi:hypothetical protein
MKAKRRAATLAAVAAALVVSTFGTAKAGKNDPDNPPPLFQIIDFGPRKTDNAILKWDEELLQAVRALPPGPTVVARAIAVVHTATYDAWAAYTALVDLFSSRRADLAAQMEELGYLTDGSDASTPAAIGTQAAQAVIDFRHGDGSNQLGGYADTTGYRPVNTGDTVTDRWRWQPLRVPLGTGPEQRAATPQWKSVTSFALTSPFQYRVPGPPEKKAAGAQILANFTGSDTFGAGVAVPAGSSLFEPRTATQPGTPAGDVTLSWPTFSAAADDAGWSRRYGGIHFQSGDENGRTLGRSVGWNAWAKAQLYVFGLTSG